MDFKHHEHCKQCDRYVTEEAKADCKDCQSKTCNTRLDAAGAVVNVGCVAVFLATLYGGYVLFSSVSGWWGSPSTPQNLSMDYLSEGGWAFRSMARDVILDHLKSPSTAEISSDREISATKVGDHLYEFSGYVDA